MTKNLDFLGYPHYEVNTDGQIYSIYTKRFLKEKINQGYSQITICHKGKQKHSTIHRLIALAFLPNPNNLPEINHKDGNKQNNKVENIEWCTKSENGQLVTTFKSANEASRQPNIPCPLF
jgi:hypothetical protein